MSTVDMKGISDTSQKLLNDLLDLSTHDLNSTELKLLKQCRINALELLRDILIILSKVESRKLKKK